MQNLSATFAAATAVWKPSVSKPHVVKARHSKWGPATEDRCSGPQARLSANPATALEQHHHTQRRTVQPRMLNATSVGKSDTLSVAASPKRAKRTWEKLKDMRKTKPAKVHELREQAAVEPWMQQQYAAPCKQAEYYSAFPQSETPEAAFHHM